MQLFHMCHIYYLTDTIVNFIIVPIFTDEIALQMVYIRGISQLIYFWLLSRRADASLRGLENSLHGLPDAVRDVYGFMARVTLHGEGTIWYLESSVP